MRIKEMAMAGQQEDTLLERAMDFICAKCDRDACFRLMAKVNDRITYIDRQDQLFRGLYGRAN